MIDGKVFSIVLVEDNAADIYLFRKALETAELHFDLTVIEDGAEALAFARQDGAHGERPKPDLVVLDLNLPKHEGSEILKTIRANAVIGQIPVMITSSSASPRERAEAERLGVVEHIVKPADLESFLQIGSVVKRVLFDGRNPPTA